MRTEAWLAAAGDLLLGAVCPGCAVPWWGLCPDCRGRLEGRRPFLARVPAGPEGPPLTVACSPYDELVGRLVTAHKDRGALALAPLLGARLALSVHGLLQHCRHSSRPVLLVPVPSAAAAVRRRGYDATGTLARLAARRLRSRYRVRAARLLTQRAGVRDQAGLTAAERSQNLQGALRLRPGRAGWTRRSWSGAEAAAGPVVVLVDDVVTTGSSLTEAARALRAAGVGVLGAATVAATERRAQRAR